MIIWLNSSLCCFCVPFIALNFRRNIYCAKKKKRKTRGTERHQNRSRRETSHANVCSACITAENTQRERILLINCGCAPTIENKDNINIYIRESLTIDSILLKSKSGIEKSTQIYTSIRETGNDGTNRHGVNSRRLPSPVGVQRRIATGRRADKN